VVGKVFSVDGLTTYTTGTSDAVGHLSFLLEEGSYQIRFFRQHASFSALLFDVQPGHRIRTSFKGFRGPNTFDVTGSILTPPTVNDPRLCVANGFFRAANGGKAPDLDIHFIAKFRPLLLDGDAVLTERVVCRTDANGYMQANLIRNGQYDVLIEGLSNITRTIYVPDAPNVNLPDLLFPVVHSVTFSPPGPYSLLVGDSLFLTPTIRVSDGRTLPGIGYDDVAWASSDTNVVCLAISPTRIELRAQAPGTATVTLTPFDTSIVRYPDPGVLGVPFTVTVS
jgi:hypothetical protein